jgi:hypothetical protein
LDIKKIVSQRNAAVHLWKSPGCLDTV